VLVDLHCHSYASDGSLSPDALVARAHALGITILSITDHDTIAGYDQLTGPIPEGIRLVMGVELSCVWGGMLVHIVGLAFDPDNTVLKACIDRLQQARAQRAVIIDQKLSKLGFTGVLERAQQPRAPTDPVQQDEAEDHEAPNHEVDRPPVQQIGRPHLAQAMVELGYVKSVNHAFKRFLGAGKLGDVKTQWPPMVDVIDAINSAGGKAVLAHPYHYSITATKLRALIDEFKQAGGSAIEVISGKQSPDKTEYLTSLAQKNGLSASCGSDFHQPGRSWNELGCHGQLPAQLDSIWADWADPVYING